MLFCIIFWIKYNYLSMKHCFCMTNKGALNVRDNDIMFLTKNLAEQYYNLMSDWLPEESSVAIAVGDTYVYFNGCQKLQLFNGKKVEAGSIVERVIKEGRKIEELMNEAFLEKPFYGIGYPITLMGEAAVLLVILSPLYQEIKNDPIRFVTGKQQDEWVLVPLEKITYFESLNKKNWCYTDDKQYTVNTTLKNLQKKLPKDFLRIHRSYIINIHAIDRITRDFSSNLMIHMEDGTGLPVSQTYLNEVKRLLDI